MVIIIAVVIVVLVIVLSVGLVRRSPAQLTRRLRSTSFSRRRSDALKRAAAADVAEVLRDDDYFRPGPGSEQDEL